MCDQQDNTSRQTSSTSGWEQIWSLSAFGQSQVTAKSYTQIKLKKLKNILVFFLGSKRKAIEKLSTLLSPIKLDTGPFKARLKELNVPWNNVRYIDGSYAIMNSRIWSKGFWFNVIYMSLFNSIKKYHTPSVLFYKEFYNFFFFNI